MTEELVIATSDDPTLSTLDRVRQIVRAARPARAYEFAWHEGPRTVHAYELTERQLHRQGSTTGFMERIRAAEREAESLRLGPLATGVTVGYSDPAGLIEEEQAEYVTEQMITGLEAATEARRRYYIERPGLAARVVSMTDAEALASGLNPMTDAIPEGQYEARAVTVASAMTAAKAVVEPAAAPVRTGINPLVIVAAILGLYLAYTQ